MMYRVRRRPQDQSSDEDEDEKLHCDEQQVIANDIQKRADIRMDFSMFKSNDVQCNKYEKADGVGIILKCSVLNRLAAAMRAYSNIKHRETLENDGHNVETQIQDPLLSDFVCNDYRMQFLEDFKHFIAEH